MAKIFNFLKKHYKKIILLVVIGLVALFVYRKFFVKPVLSLTSPQYRNLTKVLSLSGQIVAKEHAFLRFQSGGRLAWLKVSEQSIVKKGEVLANLDSVNDLRAASRVSYNTWLAADAKAKRVEDDVKGHDKDETYTQKENRVAAQTARDSAYDDWRLAERNLLDAYLIAPFNGKVVTVSNLNVGSNVSLSDSYIEVFNQDTLYFSAEVDETDLSALVGSPSATIVLDAFPDEAISSSTLSVSLSPLVDTTGTVYEVELSLPRKDGHFRLGLNGNADLILEQKQNILSLPVTTVNQSQDETTVQILVNGKPQTVKIKTGLETDEYIEILEGIKESDQIVLPNGDKKK